MADQQVSHAYYYVDLPFLALYGTTYLPISRTWQQFQVDAAAGTLPSVSFLDPKFLDEGTGTSADDHPHADIRAGQSFLDQVYRAVTHGPGWERTALVINYDEWGGFYDHVAPGVAPEMGTGLTPLTRRDAAARNMAEVLDFTRPPNLAAPLWEVPPAVSAPCGPEGTADYSDWRELESVVLAHGWRVGGAV